MGSTTGIMGQVFDVQRFCLHDGRGIRTTVFLKGCPLSCVWCHNPESQARGPERVFRAARCIVCGSCVAACSRGALRLAGDGVAVATPVVDPSLCAVAGACAAACPSGATEILGRDVAVADLLAEVRRDVSVFDESGGGVTFSGGEPLLQAEFLEAMLLACRAAGIHTTVDTSGHAPWEVVERIASLADTFLFDVKHADDEAHREFTGVSNRLIISNLGRVAELSRRTGSPEVLVRVPVVAGVNDGREAVARLGELLAALDPRPAVDLLPYQPLGRSKYERMGRDQLLPGARAPSASELETMTELLRAAGLEVTIRGDRDAEVRAD